LANVRKLNDKLWRFNKNFAKVWNFGEVGFNLVDIQNFDRLSQKLE